MKQAAVLVLALILAACSSVKQAAVKPSFVAEQVVQIPATPTSAQNYGFCNQCLGFNLRTLNQESILNNRIAQERAQAEKENIQSITTAILNEQTPGFVTHIQFKQGNASSPISTSVTHGQAVIASNQVSAVSFASSTQPTPIRSLS